MKKIISKYDGIVFPFFALKKKPYKLLYSADTICAITKTDGSLETVDDKKLQGDYFARLLQLENRITFHYTCKNLQDLILCNAKWGMDSTAVPFDLTKKEPVAARIVKVKKIKGNLVWLHSIPYPFRLSTVEPLDLDDRMYAIIIKVKHEWYIKKFTHDKINIRKVEYI